MALLAENTIIRRAEEQILQRLKEGMREPVMKLVNAGMKLAMDGGPKSIIAQLRDSKDVLHDCVKGAIGLVNVLRKSAKGSVSTGALVPAAMILALQGLDFAERLKLIKVTNQVLDQATQMFTDAILPAMGVSHERFAELTDRAANAANDPDKMRQIFVKRGT